MKKCKVRVSFCQDGDVTKKEVEGIVLDDNWALTPPSTANNKTRQQILTHRPSGLSAFRVKNIKTGKLLYDKHLKNMELPEGFPKVEPQDFCLQREDFKEILDELWELKKEYGVY